MPHRSLPSSRGACPPTSAPSAAAALEQAGCRALEREANRTARRLLLRSIELEPSLRRRFYAARAAWRMWELPAASTEMEDVRAQAQAAGDRELEGLALAQLAEILLNRNADVEPARRLGREALELLRDAPGDARYEALTLLSSVGWWEGDLSSVERYTERRVEIAREAGRPDLESLALVELAAVHHARLEVSRAEEILAEATELAQASGSLSATGVGVPHSWLDPAAPRVCSTRPLDAFRSARTTFSTRPAPCRTRRGRSSSKASPSGRAASPSAPSSSSGRLCARCFRCRSAERSIEAQRTLAEIVLDQRARRGG